MISSEVLFDLPQKTRRIEEISHLETEGEFWTDNKKAKVLTQEKSKLEAEVNGFKALEMAYSDAETMFQMAEEEKDESLMTEASEMIAPLAEQFEKAELMKMLKLALVLLLPLLALRLCPLLQPLLPLLGQA